MGKQSRAKKARRDGTGASKKGTKKVADSIGAGDLRFIEAHVNEWRKGVAEAENALVALGRDASFEVMRLADVFDDDDLRQLGKRLVALKPTVDTNLGELRVASVHAHVENARASAPKHTEVGAFRIDAAAVGFFDPIKLREVLVKGGRPRSDPKRIGAGELAWFALPSEDGAELHLQPGPPPAGQPALELRLVVESGVVFVGPPEASDGPRMGTVRLDPFRTQLDAFLDRGRFLQVEPGRYAVYAYRVEAEGSARVHVHFTPAAEGPLDIAMDALHAIPVRP